MEKVDYKTRKVQETYVNNRGVTKTRTINETYTETNTYYYHKNHLNSIVAITDNLGNILEEYEYDVFGKPYSKDLLTGKITNLKPSTIGNTRLFTGREFERGLQLYYNRARYYNPELGRFISRDPIDISDDVNLYSYVGNSAVSFVDPLGTEKAMIFVGIDSKLFGYSMGALYNAYNIQINKYLNEGYNAKNIELYFGENIDDFNYLVNNKYYKDISIVAHSNNNEVKINASSNSNESTINSETINKLPDLSGRDTILTIVGCLSGNGDNSIAEQIAKQMKITVLAPDKILIADNIKNDYFISGGTYSGKIRFLTIPYNGVQSDKIEFKTFNP